MPVGCTATPSSPHRCMRTGKAILGRLRNSLLTRREEGRMGTVRTGVDGSTYIGTVYMSDKIEAVACVTTARHRVPPQASTVVQYH